MNPPGTFKNGQRLQEYSSKNQLPLSGRLIPEFYKRRNIKDMFLRIPCTSGKGTSPALRTRQSSDSVVEQMPSTTEGEESHIMNMQRDSIHVSELTEAKNRTVHKRPPVRETFAPNQAKRQKSMAGAFVGTPNKNLQANKGQQSLKGFFNPKPNKDDDMNGVQGFKEDSQPANLDVSETHSPTSPEPQGSRNLSTLARPRLNLSRTRTRSASSEIGVSEMHASAKSLDHETVVDPIDSKECWSRLFSKRPVPKCVGHQEPCVKLTTKKNGINCGRAFWICPRPLGPSGAKEKGTQWRCSTFIWASDWNPSS